VVLALPTGGWENDIGEVGSGGRLDEDLGEGWEEGLGEGWEEGLGEIVSGGWEVEGNFLDLRGLSGGVTAAGTGSAIWPASPP
jgi:hypothetical protein